MIAVHVNLLTTSDYLVNCLTIDDFKGKGGAFEELCFQVFKKQNGSILSRVLN